MPFDRDAVKKLRRFFGSQKNLAEKLKDYARARGYTNKSYIQSTISRWERGLTQPNSDALDLLYLVAQEVEDNLEFYQKPEPVPSFDI